MIVRIMGEGQWEVDDASVDELNRLDDTVVAAVDAGDGSAYAAALAQLVAAVKSGGRPVPDDSVVPSDALLPSEDVTLAELRDLLGDEGLIPG